MRNKWKIKKWINEKITFNFSFRLVSFRRRNVFQTRWMMPAACCRSEGEDLVNSRDALLIIYISQKNEEKMQKWINKLKDHFQYLLSFDLRSAKERLPNALNDACRLLFKEKTIIQSKMRTVYETSLLSLLSLFLFSFVIPLRWNGYSI